MKIGSGTECTPSTGEDADLLIGIIFELEDGLVKRLRRYGINRILPSRTIDSYY